MTDDEHEQKIVDHLDRVSGWICPRCHFLCAPWEKACVCGLNFADRRGVEFDAAVRSEMAAKITYPPDRA